MELTKWISAIRQQGLKKTLHRFLVSSDIKSGKLVGTDAMGNEYYHNVKETVLGRDRWVVYAQRTSPKDGANIPPEWHSWMHKLTDVPPNAKDADRFYVPKASFVDPSLVGNKTGIDEAFKAYDTTRPKVFAWKPPTK